MKRTNLLTKAFFLVMVLMGSVCSAWADTYVKVTSESDLVAGETYIIASDDGVAITYSNKKLNSTNTGYTTVGDALFMTTTTPLEFVLGKVSGNYSLKMPDGKMLGYSGSSTDFRNSETKASAKNEQWTITYNATYNMFTIVTVNSSNRHIGYSGSNKFAPYVSISDNSPATLYKKQPAFSITAESNDENMGTVSLAGAVITATPTEGHRISKTNPYTITGENVEVVQEGNTFTVTANADCTICINFEVIPTHNAIFVVNGATTSSVFGEDEKISFPTNIDAIGTYSFVGWATELISGKQSQKPELVSSVFMRETDVTFYAVFAEGSVDAIEGSYTLYYDSEDALSSSTDWGSYGKTYTYTAKDGSVWIVKAYKKQGMQINIGQNCSIKVPNCPGNITTINVTTTNSNSVGFSAKDYIGSGTISYLAYDESASINQVLDLTGKSVTTGYIVPKDGATVIKKIVVHYEELVENYYNFCTTLAEDITIGSLGYLTYSSANALDFSDVAVKAYSVKYENGSAKLTEVETVPAGAGVVLKGAAATYSVKLTAEASAIENNDLQVSDGTVQGNGSVYCLADGSKGVGFYRVATTVTVPEGKCYLEIPAQSGEARQFIGFDDETTTAISDHTDLMVQSTSTVYNLRGQRVAQPQKGLYIVNGKKVVKK